MKMQIMKCAADVSRLGLFVGQVVDNAIIEANNISGSMLVTDILSCGENKKIVLNDYHIA